MILPAETAFMDQQRAWLRDTVRRCGVALTYVSDDECECCRAVPQSRAARRNGTKQKPSERFGYTTGLHGIGHPELVLFGLDRLPTSGLLNGLAHEVFHGEVFMPGEVRRFDELDVTFRVEEMRNPRAHVVAANAFYEMPRGSSVRAFTVRPLAV